jgi:hypothetical protein
MNKIKFENAVVQFEPYINKNCIGKDELTLRISTDVPHDYEVQQFNELLTETFDSSVLSENPEGFTSEIYMSLTPDEAIKFSQELIKQALLVKELSIKQELNQKLKMVQLKNAHLACLRGEIGQLKIIYTGTTSRIGFYKFTLEYYNDVDNALVYSIDEIDFFIPLDQEGQYNWLRTLVGGNHQFTTSIGIKTENFSEFNKEFLKLKT